LGNGDNKETTGNLEPEKSKEDKLETVEKNQERIN